jgi:hypothetical protein
MKNSRVNESCLRQRPATDIDQQPSHAAGVIVTVNARACLKPHMKKGGQAAPSSMRSGLRG